MNETPTYEELQAEVTALRAKIAAGDDAQNVLGKIREELIDHKLLAKAVLNASSDTVVVTDVAGNVLAVNENGAARLHTSVENLLGSCIYDAMPPELVSRRKRWLNQAIETRKPIQFKDEHRGQTYGHRLFPYTDPRTNSIRAVWFTRDISESERAVKALRESEARYRAILEDQTELICRYLPDGRLSYVNEAYARYFGKDRRELINRNFIPHIPDEDLRMINAHIGQLCPDKPVTTFEHQVIMENGETRWQSWTHRAIYDTAGHLTESQAVGRDVTPRRVAQEALADSEGRYRSLFEDSPISLWENDFSLIRDYLDSLRAQGVTDFRQHFQNDPHAVEHCVASIGVLDVNKATLELFGAEHKRDILGKMAPVILPETLDFFRTVFIALSEGQHVVEGQSVMQTWQGERKHVHLHLNIAPGYEDSFSKVLISMIDVTARMKVEKELNEQRAFLYQIIDTVPSPIFVKDREGYFILVNRAMSEIYGVTPADLTGKRGEDFNLNEDETSIFRAEDLEVLDSQEPLYIPQRIVTDSTGRPRWHSTTKLPLAGKDQVLGVAVDITERKQVETERHKMEMQLHQSQKLQALGTLAGGIAHDFNNMIFAILGFTRLALKHATPNSKLEEYLQQVQAAGMRASDLVRQILTFSRQTEQETKPIRLSTLFKEVAKLLRATLPTTIELKVSINTSESENSDIILGDPTQIHQVLMNLATNAGHSMLVSGGVLEMELRGVEISESDAAGTQGLKPGRHLEMLVKDTGHGIDSAVIEQIFDPFFTTKKPGEGTGMGLSVAHGIIKSHGGNIFVESQVGKGSTFRVLLPKFESPIALREAECPPIPHGGERILFVDDETLLVQMVQDMLTQLGYQVTAKTQPDEALELFQADPQVYDLVITDQTMPVMTGMDLARKMLAIRPDTPIILLTGYSEAVTSETAHQAGIREFIMKPVVEAQIAKTIRSIFDNRQCQEATWPE